MEFLTIGGNVLLERRLKPGVDRLGGRFIIRKFGVVDCSFGNRHYSFEEDTTENVKGLIQTMPDDREF